MSQAMIYLVAVVAASYLLPRLAAVGSAIGAVAALNFFFVPPRYTLAVEHHEHLIALVAMLAVALLVSYLSAMLKRESTAARESESRAGQLRSLAIDLAAAGSEDEAVEVGRRALLQRFAGPVLLVTSVDGAIAPGVDVARTCSAPCAAASTRLRCSVPAPGDGPGSTPGTCRSARAIASSARRASSRRWRATRSAASTRRRSPRWLRRASGACASSRPTSPARAEVDRQHVQATFLACVSHDLRTPLAAIVAAASSLEAQRSRLADEEQGRMLAGIVAEARYLTAVTENTLQLVRLSAGGGALETEWQSIEEIVGSVVGRLRSRPSGGRIRARLGRALPLVRGDATLLAQLATNLIDNALKYSDGAVDLTVVQQGDRLVLSVKDRGPGLAPGDESRVFAAFYRGRDASDARGAGLGLALCRSIAAAHGGSLGVSRRARGGLPLHAGLAGRRTARSRGTAMSGPARPLRRGRSVPLGVTAHSATVHR
jgi:two-component system sensor histidine kinase KdpD